MNQIDEQNLQLSPISRPLQRSSTKLAQQINLFFVRFLRCRRHLASSMAESSPISSLGIWLGRTRTLRHDSFRDRWFNCSPERDYCEILGIPRNASPDEIRKRLFMLLNKNNPSAKRKFQEIRDAYETLQDSEKRAEYNRGFHYSADAQGFRFEYGTHFSCSFHKIFYELSLSFSGAAKGCIRDLSFDAYVRCNFFHGLGYALDT